MNKKEINKYKEEVIEFLEQAKKGLEIITNNIHDSYKLTIHIYNIIDIIMHLRNCNEFNIIKESEDNNDKD